MDKFNKKTRSRIMSTIRSCENKTTEIALLKLLKENRIRGWRRKQKIYGKPDFYFPQKKLIIFVDGCFWHGCKCRKKTPKTNKEFWKEKIARNKKRDAEINKKLKIKKYKVLRFWEHQIEKEPQKVIKKIKNSLR